MLAGGLQLLSRAGGKDRQASSKPEAGAQPHAAAKGPAGLQADRILLKSAALVQVLVVWPFSTFACWVGPCHPKGCLLTLAGACGRCLGTAPC